MFINVKSDYLINSMKRNKGPGYHIPDQFLYKYLSAPNYFGEIVLWIGIAIIAFPVIEGWQYVALISPIFVIFLLTMVSGVNLLERQGMQKWGHEEDYLNYLKRTSSLIPLPPKG